MTPHQRTEDFDHPMAWSVADIPTAPLQYMSDTELRQAMVADMVKASAAGISLTEEDVMRFVPTEEGKTRVKEALNHPDTQRFMDAEKLENGEFAIKNTPEKMQAASEYSEQPFVVVEIQSSFKIDCACDTPPPRENFDVSMDR